MEIQGASGDSSEICITRLCKMLCRSHDDQRAGSFLKQRISMALQIGNAACFRKCERQRCVCGDFFTNGFLKPVYLCSVSRICFYRSTKIVADMSSLMVVLFCYWTTGIVAGMRFRTSGAEHGCVSSHPNMMIHMALD